MADIEVTLKLNDQISNALNIAAQAIRNFQTQINQMNTGFSGLNANTTNFTNNLTQIQQNLNNVVNSANNATTALNNLNTAQNSAAASAGGGSNSLTTNIFRFRDSINAAVNSVAVLFRRLARLRTAFFILITFLGVRPLLRFFDFIIDSSAEASEAVERIKDRFRIVAIEVSERLAPAFAAAYEFLFDLLGKISEKLSTSENGFRTLFVAVVAFGKGLASVGSIVLVAIGLFKLYIETFVAGVLGLRLLQTKVDEIIYGIVVTVLKFVRDITDALIKGFLHIPTAIAGFFKDIGKSITDEVERWLVILEPIKNFGGTLASGLASSLIAILNPIKVITSGIERLGAAGEETAKKIEDGFKGIGISGVLEFFEDLQHKSKIAAEVAGLALDSVAANVSKILKDLNIDSENMQENVKGFVSLLAGDIPESFKVAANSAADFFGFVSGVITNLKDKSEDAGNEFANQWRIGLEKAEKETNDAIRKAQEKFAKAGTRSLKDQLIVALGEIIEEYDNAFQRLIKGISSAIKSGIIDTLEDALDTGLSNGRQLIDAFLRDIRRKLIEFAYDQLAAGLIKTVVGGVLGSIGAGGGTGQNYGSTGNAVYGTPKQEGGLAYSAQRATIGEVPEAVIPLRRGKVPVMLEGGGGKAVVLNFNIQTVDSTSFDGWLLRSKKTINGIVQDAASGKSAGMRSVMQLNSV